MYFFIFNFRKFYGSAGADGFGRDGIYGLYNWSLQQCSPVLVRNNK